MVDRIDKQLKKLSPKQRIAFQKLIEQIQAGDLQKLDVVKLIGYVDVFRVRKGEYRIIFRKLENEIKILAFEHRSDSTYKEF